MVLKLLVGLLSRNRFIFLRNPLDDVSNFGGFHGSLPAQIALVVGVVGGQIILVVFNAGVFNVLLDLFQLLQMQKYASSLTIYWVQIRISLR